MTVTSDELAARLGVPAGEVLEHRPAPGKDGHLVTTADGVVYHIGKQRVAFYANFPEHTTFPVYSPPPDLKAEEPLPEAEEPVPEGAAGKVLAWVNRDQARAARALAAEKARPEGEQRATLLEQLQRLANP